MAPPPQPPPPPPPVSLRAGILLLRLLTAASLVVSVILLSTNNVTLDIQGFSTKIRFNDVYAYRYMFSAAVIGLAYAAIQLFFAISQFATGNAQPIYLLDFYGDKIVSYLVATGSAAGFGVTKDLKDTVFGSNTTMDKFFSKGYGAASLLLIAFICLAVLSTFSSYALPKRQIQS